MPGLTQMLLLFLAALSACLAHGPKQHSGHGALQRRQLDISANLNLIGGKKASFYQLDGTTQTACGETKYSADWIVALGDDLFSQDKCGKSITLMNYDTGIEKTATISDRCEICASAGRIDLAEGLYQALGGTVNQGLFSLGYAIQN